MLDAFPLSLCVYVMMCLHVCVYIGVYVGVCRGEARLVLLSLSAKRRQTELAARGTHREQGRKGQEKDRARGWAHRHGWRGEEEEEEEEEEADSPRCLLGVGFSSRPFRLALLLCLLPRWLRLDGNTISTIEAGAFSGLGNLR